MVIDRFCPYDPLLAGRGVHPESEESWPATGKVMVGLVTISPPAGEDSRSIDVLTGPSENDTRNEESGRKDGPSLNRGLQVNVCEPRLPVCPLGRLSAGQAGPGWSPRDCCAPLPSHKRTSSFKASGVLLTLLTCPPSRAHRAGFPGCVSMPSAPGAHLAEGSVILTLVALKVTHRACGQVSI